MIDKNDSVFVSKPESTEKKTGDSIKVKLTKLNILTYFSYFFLNSDFLLYEN